ncbi:MAG: hypothetical protein EBT79_09525 [Actinobacteria bacterium]|nr:hypothetical protein [Actinomycetota bacterium]
MPFVAGAYAVLRATAVVGLPAARFPDSTGYLTLDLSTPIARPLPVPLVYVLAATDTARVAVQVILGIAAWVWLARELSEGSRRPGTVRWMTAVVGLTPQVIRFDQAILAESLTITAGVALVAATVRTARSGKAPTASAGWVAAFVVFAMVRPHHMLVLFAVAATVTARSLAARRSPGVLGAVMLLVAVLGLQQLRSNTPTSNLNLYTILTERVVTDPAATSWFVSNGMPAVDLFDNPLTYDTPDLLAPELLAVLDLPEGQMPPRLMRLGGMPLAQWVRDDGWTTYARWIATHPSDNLSRLVDLVGPTLDVADDGFLPLDSRTVVPRVFFVPTAVSAIIALAGAAVSVLRRRRRDAAVPFAVLLGAFSLYAIAMTTSGIEHPRHAAVAAVLVRLAALVGAAQLLAGRVRKDVPVDASPSA